LSAAFETSSWALFYTDVSSLCGIVGTIEHETYLGSEDVTVDLVYYWLDVVLTSVSS
jgi:hypothetical protein